MIQFTYFSFILDSIYLFIHLCIAIPYTEIFLRTVHVISRDYNTPGVLKGAGIHLLEMLGMA